MWAVIGNLGDSQCYLGVRAKVAAVFTPRRERIAEGDLAVRLIAPAFSLGVSDGQLNGTDRMRYSLISREVVNDVTAAPAPPTTWPAWSPSWPATSRPSARWPPCWSTTIPP